MLSIFSDSGYTRRFRQGYCSSSSSRCNVDFSDRIGASSAGGEPGATGKGAGCMTRPHRLAPCGAGAARSVRALVQLGSLSALGATLGYAGFAP
jgi:hypothetical protein